MTDSCSNLICTCAPLLELRCMEAGPFHVPLPPPSPLLLLLPDQTVTEAGGRDKVCGEYGEHLVRSCIWSTVAKSDYHLVDAAPVGELIRWPLLFWETRRWERRASIIDPGLYYARIHASDLMAVVVVVIMPGLAALAQGK